MNYQPNKKQIASLRWIVNKLLPTVYEQKFVLRIGKWKLVLYKSIG